MVMHKRFLGSLSYSANGKSTLEIPKDSFLKKLTCRIRGQCDSGSVVSRSENNPTELIKRMEIVANGKDTIKSVSFANSYIMDKYQSGTTPEKVQTPASASQSNQSFSATTYIDFDLDRDELDTLLPAQELNTLQLVITWGQATDVDSGTGFNIDWAYLDVTVEEEGNPEEMGLEAQNMGVIKEFEIVQDVTASGVQTIKLPLGNVYQKIFLKVVDNGVQSNTLCTDFEVLLNGLQTVRKERFDMSRADDKTEYGLESVENGVTMIDFDLGGSEPIDTGEASSFELKINCGTPTGTANISVVTQELILPNE
ncbi:hypothetical protein JXA48_02525 [Candidatus Woesearchaeota archaeon]|nr:hypothetical protein [Candidatus Woesearchaeota archaeon]